MNSYEKEKTSIPKIYEGEYRMCLILWENEPIRIAALARLCSEQLGWSRTATYTVVKRLEERGILETEKGSVRTRYTKEEVQSAEMATLFEKTFEGSLPAFVAAFVRNHAPDDQEISEMQAMIERFRSGN